MAVRYLTDGELQRLRYELGANVVGVGAEPYIGHQQVFDLIQDNLQSDATEPAISATSVTTAGSATLTLDSVSGISQFDRLVVDTDDQYEIVTVQRVSGSTITARFQKTHTTPYPVEKESGVTLVRCKLWTLGSLERQIHEASANAGIKRVDEVEFFGRSEGGSALENLARQQAMHRRELASLVNLEQVLDSLGFGRAGSGFSLY